MRLRNSRLRDAITLAIATGAFALGGSAMAQEAAAAQSAPATAAQTTAAATKPATTLDKVEVTGTRIRQSDLETAQPVLIISREDIDKSGFQSVADILQNISAVGSPPISRASPLSAGENAGGTFISLRNLGAARTLVLLNGRRLGISTSGLADVSVIPAAAVERIEVLKDGASSMYGSDAIAGVINIITRSNFEGASASVYLGQYDEVTATSPRATSSWASTATRARSPSRPNGPRKTRCMPATATTAPSRARSLHPTDGWTTVGEFGGWRTTAATMGPGVPVGTRVVLRRWRQPARDHRLDRPEHHVGTCAGATEAVAARPASILHKSNTNLQTDLHTPLESSRCIVDGIYNLNDNILFRTNLLYSNRDMTRTVAGYPMQAASFATRRCRRPATSTRPARHHQLVAAYLGSAARQRLRADHLPLQRRLRGQLRLSRALHRLGCVLPAQPATIWCSRPSATSTWPTSRAAVGPSFLNAATGQVQCGTAAAPIAGCVPFNPFVGVGITAPGGLEDNQALRDYLFQEEHASGETTTTVFAANLSGTMFELPAGDLGFALGYENRKEDGEFVPDALAVTGNSTNLSAGPTRGGYSVDEVYLELEVPILEEMAFAKELSFNVASR